MPTKNELLELVEEIKECMKCHSPYEEMTTERSVFFRDMFLEGPWFFPPRGSVKGFLGTGGVMLVAEKPSTGKPFKKGDPLFFFYDLLEKYGFSDAHITDCIKCRGDVRDKTRMDDEFKNCSDWLKREIRSIDPKLIIAVGDNAYQELKTLKLNVPLEKVNHYSWVRRGKENGNKLEEQFKRIRGIWKNCTI